jgi:hypothetical protein
MSMLWYWWWGNDWGVVWLMWSMIWFWWWMNDGAAGARRGTRWLGSEKGDEMVREREGGRDG